MSPLRGEEFTGRTVEEAIEIGLRQLGRKRSDVDIEVLDRGKPANMLGMGGEDARVLLSFTEDENAEPEPVVDEAEVPRRPDAIRAAAERRRESFDSREQSAPRAPSPPREPRVRSAEEEEGSPALLADLTIGAEVLREILAKMGVEAEVVIEQQPGLEGLDVLGADLGVLIGRGGENLVALQQITSAITSRKVARSVHVPVDIEGYRRRREDQLREIAQRVAERVRASGQAVTLEPMLAYERRIVHMSMKEEQGVRTESVGIDPNRRVVISSTAPGARGPAPTFAQRPGGFNPRPGFGARPGGRPGGFGGPRPGGFRPRGFGDR